MLEFNQGQYKPMKILSTVLVVGFPYYFRNLF